MEIILEELWIICCCCFFPSLMHLHKHSVKWVFVVSAKSFRFAGNIWVEVFFRIWFSARWNVQICLPIVTVSKYSKKMFLAQDLSVCSFFLFLLIKSDNDVRLILSQLVDKMVAHWHLMWRFIKKCPERKRSANFWQH